MAKLLDDPNATLVPEDEDALGSGSEDEEVKPESLSWRERIVQLATGTAPGQKVTSNSPTARLKLLLVSPFCYILERADEDRLRRF